MFNNENNLNTATLRNMARESEAKLDWFAAADFYCEALRMYPRRYVAGTLEALDMDNLRNKATSCVEFGMNQAGISKLTRA